MANEYSVSVTPFRRMVCGLPIATFTATLISLILYLISIILIFATGCLKNSNASYFLAFLILAMLATCCMAAINMMYSRNHFSCLNLSVSLLYSGSAALVILGLLVTALNGMCPKVKPEEKMEIRSIEKSVSSDGMNVTTDKRIENRDLFEDSESTSLFRSGHVGSYFIWTFSAIADAFQIVAHYYYG